MSGLPIYLPNGKVIGVDRGFDVLSRDDYETDQGESIYETFGVMPRVSERERARLDNAGEDSK